MHKTIIFLLLVCLIFSACTPLSDFAPTQTGYPQAITTPTITLAPLGTSTQRSAPTFRPTGTRLPTLTIPPPTDKLATPTIVPTFDIQANVTFTPAPKAECPKVSSIPNPNPGFPDFSYNTVIADFIAFLNQYGAQALYKAAKSFNNPNELKLSRALHDTILQDLTNDGEPEIAIGPISFFVFGCRTGQYTKLFELKPDGYDHAPDIVTIQDANNNGIPELTMFLERMSQGGHSFGVFEWDGKKFSSLIALNQPFDFDYGSIWVEATGKIHYEDVDHDSIQELVVDSGIPIWETYSSGLPWRNKQSTYKWDGKYFSVKHVSFAPPEFRFQAVQDADLAVSQQEYAKAMDLYQQAIFKNELKAYSPEIRQNLRDRWQLQLLKTPTPTPVSSDPAEYSQLAAYAYYRMVILHTFLGEMDAAQVKYATLQDKFSQNNPGGPYTELATVFWNAYAPTKQITAGCNAAIKFASEHIEILTPLGSDYHGDQAHRYSTVDICPFQ